MFKQVGAGARARLTLSVQSVLCLLGLQRSRPGMGAHVLRILRGGR